MVGVIATSSASTTCDANGCGSNVQFSATIPWRLSHRAESLSASQFCGGMASAKKALAHSKYDGSIIVPNEADVTVLITDVHAHEDEVDWVAIIITGAFVTFLCAGLCGIVCAACGKR